MAYYGKDVEEYLMDAVHPIPYRNRPVPSPLREQDREIISNYMSERVSLKPSTAKVTATYLVMTCRKLKAPLPDVDTKTMLLFIKDMETALKQNTRRRFYPILKNFLQWLHDEGVNINIDMKKISPALKPPALDLDGRKKSTILSGDDIKKLLESAHTSRDRAIIAMMYEGSLRPIEVISATWADLVFDKYGAQFNTSKKTGKSRYIRLIMAAPYLLSWKNDHPNPSKDNPVFINLKSAKKIRPLTQSGIKTLFYAIGKEALPDRDIHPYLMRHSRITAMMADEIPNNIIMKQAWGSVSTRMLATYEHLVNTDTDRILLSRAGITTEETHKDAALKAIQCSNCGKIHEPTAKFCLECGKPLTDESRKQVQSDEERLLELFKRFMAEQKQP